MSQGTLRRRDMIDRVSAPSRRPKAKTAVRPCGADPFEAELSHISRLGIDDLRALWRTTFRNTPPPALSRDMLARMITYRMQEARFGALDPSIRKLLIRLASGHREPARRLKVGSVIVREYPGTRHEVIVVSGGFEWQGEVHGSLSTVARAITGTAWNGPRFFGLRGKTKSGVGGEPEKDADPVAVRPTARGSIQSSRAVASEPGNRRRRQPNATQQPATGDRP